MDCWRTIRSIPRRPASIWRCWRSRTPLSRLIENFLTFSLLERNRHRFVFAPSEPAAIVAAAVDTVRDRVPGDCDLRIDVPPALPGGAWPMPRRCPRRSSTCWRTPSNTRRRQAHRHSRQSGWQWLGAQSRPWITPPRDLISKVGDDALGSAADAHQDVDVGALTGGRDAAGHVAVHDELGACAGGADLLDIAACAGRGPGSSR